MQTNKILSAPLIDLIFDGRNKEYGAYELRKTYERRIKKSLIVTFSILAVSIGGAAIAGSLKKVGPRYDIRESMTLTEVKTEDPKIEPIEPVKKIEEVQVKTAKFTEMVIVEDDKVVEPPTEVAELIDAQIDLKTKEGDPFEGIATPPSEGAKIGIVEERKDKPEEIVDFVEIEAEFKGNWRAFLERNLNPETPVENSAPAGRYSVVMQFVVDVNGVVSDIKALTNHGYGMEQEAVRVLKKAAKWEPAIQNGIHVKAYRKQTIIFDVQSE